MYSYFQQMDFGGLQSNLIRLLLKLGKQIVHKGQHSEFLDHLITQEGVPEL